jgi:hypothetical protein
MPPSLRQVTLTPMKFLEHSSVHLRIRQKVAAYKAYVQEELVEENTLGVFLKVLKNTCFGLDPITSGA